MGFRPVEEMRGPNNCFEADLPSVERSVERAKDASRKIRDIPIGEGRFGGGGGVVPGLAVQPPCLLGVRVANDNDEQRSTRPGSRLWGPGQHSLRERGSAKWERQGPAFWGLINPQWNMCNKGRRQSPINVEPEKLLFDPYLRSLHIDKHKPFILHTNKQLDE
uniref:Uncharacterized protein n=1 Tax=Anopheles albimanus TaxID=7167 RepID=A0A182FIP4_ANOAL